MPFWTCQGGASQNSVCHRLCSEQGGKLWLPLSIGKCKIMASGPAEFKKQLAEAIKPTGVKTGVLVRNLGLDYADGEQKADNNFGQKAPRGKALAKKGQGRRQKAQHQGRQHKSLGSWGLGEFSHRHLRRAAPSIQVAGSGGHLPL